jgi:5'-nucleotidase
MPDKLQILLTNDDGIQSPGLWAAAEALSELGFVHVVAPRLQSSGTGRSLPNSSDGIISSQTLRVHEKDWTVYAVGGTPAQAVLHGVLEVIGTKPALVVSGINYGENLGTAVTASGTIGAALEAATMGVPALAISLQVPTNYQLTYSRQIDFSTAAYFTTFFGRQLLANHLPADVDVLKVDVPAEATLNTPWQITRQSRIRYYEPIPPQRRNWEEPGTVGYEMKLEPGEIPEDTDTDVYALLVKHVVSVTPLSIDLTSRVNLDQLEILLRK